MHIKTQIVIWTAKICDIGGIETFVYDFCMNFKDDYDITVLYDDMDEKQISRLDKYLRVIKNNPNLTIECDTLIINRISDLEPLNVKYKKKIRMIHGCKMYDSWKVPNDNYDVIVPVSEVVKKSFNKEIDSNKCKVINNITYPKDITKALRLISATRLTPEKGGERMIKLAQILKDNNIPFIWTIFSNSSPGNLVEGMTILPPQLDISSYIKSSDYLVQLSDIEGFGYSIVEALELGVPVITTPIDVLNEIGFVDRKHGFILPFDMNDINVDDIKNGLPNFTYTNNNESKIKVWKDLLGNTLPLHDYVCNLYDEVKIKCINHYYSIVLKRNVVPGEILITTRKRAEKVLEAGKAIIIES